MHSLCDVWLYGCRVHCCMIHDCMHSSCDVWLYRCIVHCYDAWLSCMITWCDVWLYRCIVHCYEVWLYAFVVWWFFAEYLPSVRAVFWETAIPWYCYWRSHCTAGMCVCMSVFVCTCVFIYVCVYMCLCLYVCLCMLSDLSRTCLCVRVGSAMQRVNKRCGVGGGLCDWLINDRFMLLIFCKNYLHPNMHHFLCLFWN